MVPNPKAETNIEIMENEIMREMRNTQTSWLGEGEEESRIQHNPKEAEKIVTPEVPD